MLQVNREKLKPFKEAGMIRGGIPPAKYYTIKQDKKTIFLPSYDSTALSFWKFFGRDQF